MLSATRPGASSAALETRLAAIAQAVSLAALQKASKGMNGGTIEETPRPRVTALLATAPLSASLPLRPLASSSAAASAAGRIVPWPGGSWAWTRVPWAGWSSAHQVG